MPDIFDEFMDELKRRSAGQPPSDRGPRRVGPEPPEDEPPDDEPPDGERRDSEPPRRMPRRDVRPAPGGPRLRLWLIAGLVILLLFLLTGGIDFWTDVIWYQSVHFDSVFWTRLLAGVGLFVGGLVVAALVLLGNLRLAGRLAPPARGPMEGPDARIGRVARARASRSRCPISPRPSAG
jgi:hypothetical protein